MYMLNLTQHPATPEQRAAGVIDLPANAGIADLLTFDALPTRQEIEERAKAIAALALHYQCGEDRADDDGRLPPGDNGGYCHAAMIGGAPWLMSALERELHAVHIEAYYAFSRRESVEVAQPDGTVRKTNVFRHAGFVPAFAWSDGTPEPRIRDMRLSEAA